MAHPDTRGSICVVLQLFIILGSLIASILCLIFINIKNPDDKLGLHIRILFVPPICFILGQIAFFFGLKLEETPNYYLEKGKLDEYHNMVKQVNLLREFDEQLEYPNEKLKLSSLFKTWNLKRLRLGIVFCLISNACGINILIITSYYIAKDDGVSLITNISVSIIFTSICAVFIDCILFIIYSIWQKNPIDYWKFYVDNFTYSNLYFLFTLQFHVFFN